MPVLADVKLVPGYDPIGSAFATTDLRELDHMIKYSQWPKMYTLRGEYFTAVDGLVFYPDQVIGLEIPMPYLIPMEIALNSWIINNFKVRSDQKQTLIEWLAKDYYPTLYISAGD